LYFFILKGGRVGKVRRRYKRFRKRQNIQDPNTAAKGGNCGDFGGIKRPGPRVWDRIPREGEKKREKVSEWKYAQHRTH